MLFFAIGGALIFALLGVIAGLWANRMDEQAAVTNFVVAPVTLLSGTFFSVGALPPAYQYVARLDPFLYVVDGFRGGFSGVAEESAAVAVAIVAASTGLLFVTCHRLLTVGWRLRH
jgi:ABC-2 type transport system permease protein